MINLYLRSKTSPLHKADAISYFFVQVMPILLVELRLSCHSFAVCFFQDWGSFSIDDDFGAQNIRSSDTSRHGIGSIGVVTSVDINLKLQVLLIFLANQFGLLFFKLHANFLSFLKLACIVLGQIIFINYCTQVLKLVIQSVFYYI